jgi:hypothetical protein
MHFTIIPDSRIVIPTRTAKTSFFHIRMPFFMPFGLNPLSKITLTGLAVAQ